MLILLPPSEGKSSEAGQSTFRSIHPEYAEDTRAVLKELKKLKSDSASKVYGVKDEKKARAVHKQNLGVLDAPAMLALERYTGVVYQHLEYKTLRKKADARKRIVVVSGMFGAVRGGDSLPNYKLPINPWLVKFWRPLNATRLAEWAQGERVLSLLPQAYTKAVAYDLLFHVDFRVEGGKKSAGHFGKAIKGKFVRWLIENKVNRVVDIDGFKEDGYRWGGECFVKE